jgi:hypothetical protein
MHARRLSGDFGHERKLRGGEAAAIQQSHEHGAPSWIGEQSSSSGDWVFAIHISTKTEIWNIANRLQPFDGES